MKTKQAIHKYANYMKEIKYRTDVIDRCIGKHKKGESLSGYKETDIEICFLQFRKCLELIMYATVITHYAEGIKLQKRIVESEYNATKMLKFLRRVNPNFYPRPVKDTANNKDIRTVDGLVDGYLTQKEFCHLYDRICGGLLHAKRQDQFSEKHDEYFDEIELWLSKLTTLLNHHWVHISEEVAVSVIMQTGVGGEVNVALLQKVGQ